MKGRAHRPLRGWSGTGNMDSFFFWGGELFFALKRMCTWAWMASSEVQGLDPAIETKQIMLILDLFLWDVENGHFSVKECKDNPPPLYLKKTDLLVRDSFWLDLCTRTLLLESKNLFLCSLTMHTRISSGCWFYWFLFSRGEFGLREYSEVKTVTVKIPQKNS